MTPHKIAPLIRGLLLTTLGKPCTVIFQKEGPAPEASWKTLVPLELPEGVSEEKAIADLLVETLAAWRKKYPGLLPASAAVKTKTATGQVESLFWLGSTWDEADLRRRNWDNSSWKLPAIPQTADASAARRSEVVKDRVALVTGGAQGFGEEIVRGLVASGAVVYVADLNVAGAEKLVEDLNAQYKRTAAFAVQVNVGEEASVTRLFETVAETTGGLDLCVSNAGVLRAASVLEQDLASFQFSTNVNYVGFFLVAQATGRLLRLQNLTAPHWLTDLIQINSKSGLEGSNKNGAYAGSKFGGLGLVQSFALELVEHGIKVNAICPGNFLDGPLWSDPEKGLFVQYLKTGKVKGAKTVADVRAFYEAKVPLGRGCTGADVLKALYYIVEQTYETGQAVPVTGGQVMLK